MRWKRWKEIHRYHESQILQKTTTKLKNISTEQKYSKKMKE